jgi:uncharacterized protein YigE (DUF2233 family)
MQNHKIITLTLALLVTLATPAQAQAPKLSKSELVLAQAVKNPKAYAKLELYKKGHSKKQWSCLAQLWGKESAWNHLADNPTSSAFGIAQMLNETSKSPIVQINKGLRYIEHRYKTPCNAWNFWRKNYWY